jgi:hypothetical protein
MGSPKGRVVLRWESDTVLIRFKCTMVALKLRRGLIGKAAFVEFKKLVPWAFDYCQQKYGVELTANRLIQRQHKGTFAKNKSEWPNLKHPDHYAFVSSYVDEGKVMPEPTGAEAEPATTPVVFLSLEREKKNLLPPPQPAE